MNSEITVGIVGMGRMGITHFSILNSHPNVRITSVADPSTPVLSMVGKYLPVETYKDYNDLISKSRPDAIVVSTPPHLHYDILKTAAANKIHAFVEKPFTTSHSAAIQIAELYEKGNLINQVGYVNRFNDIFQFVKQLIDDRILGEVIRFKSEMFSCTISKRDETTGWRASHSTGGGVVFEMASHAIDLVNFLVGPPPNVIGTAFNKIFSADVEDVVSSTFTYDKSTTGTVYVNWSDESFRKPTNRIELFSDQGKILADQYNAKIFLKNSNAKYNLRKGWNTVYITDVVKSVPFYVRGNEFTRQLYHFIECIQDKKKSICSFGDACLTHEVIEKMFNDVKTK